MTAVRRLAAALLLAAVAVLAPSPVVAQDPPTSSTLAELPPADIVPLPNTGKPPEEAGDRGGALQLGLLALVVAVIAGAVLHLVRQSRRARADQPSSE